MRVTSFDVAGLIGQPLVETTNYEMDGEYYCGGRRGDVVGHFVETRWTWRGRRASVWYLFRESNGHVRCVRSDFATFPKTTA